MAHIDKYTRLQVHALLDHDMRTIPNHTNENIDPARSDSNKNLLHNNPWITYCQRIDQVKVLNRKDVNVLAAVTITLPNDVKPSDQDKFFQSCLEFIQNDFGSENVVSAIVHNDETTPHIHIKAIPVVHDPNKNIDKVNFKKKCDRSYYQTFHQRLDARITTVLGYKVSILNGGTVDKDMSVSQLKALTAVEQAKKLEQMAVQNQDPVSKKPPVHVLGHGNMIDYESYSNAIDELNREKALNKPLKEDNRSLEFELKAQNKANREILRDTDWLKHADLINSLQSTVNSLKQEVQNLKNTISGMEWYKNFYNFFIRMMSSVFKKDEKLGNYLLDELNHPDDQLVFDDIKGELNDQTNDIEL